MEISLPIGFVIIKIPAIKANREKIPITHESTDLNPALNCIPKIEIPAIMSTKLRMKSMNPAIKDGNNKKIAPAIKLVIPPGTTINEGEACIVAIDEIRLEIPVIINKHPRNCTNTFIEISGISIIAIPPAIYRRLTMIM
jgi:hypothetical protein